MRTLPTCGVQSGILPPRVEKIDDLHRLGADTIDEDIVRMHHRLARPGYAAGAIHEGMFRQPFGAGLDQILQCRGGLRVSLRNVADGGPDILARRRPPDESQHFFGERPLASMIARSSAITSS